jgi:hypothetical protein
MARKLRFHQDFSSMKPLPQDDLSLRVNAQEYEADHSSKSNIEVKMRGIKPPHCVLA